MSYANNIKIRLEIVKQDMTIKKHTSKHLKKQSETRAACIFTYNITGWNSWIQIFAELVTTGKPFICYVNMFRPTDTVD